MRDDLVDRILPTLPTRNAVVAALGKPEAESSTATGYSKNCLIYRLFSSKSYAFGFETIDDCIYIHYGIDGAVTSVVYAEGQF